MNCYFFDPLIHQRIDMCNLRALHDIRDSNCRLSQSGEFIRRAPKFVVSLGASGRAMHAWWPLM